MAKTTKITATDPQTGVVFTRTTARTYTHVVVGTANQEAGRKRAENVVPDKTDLSNFRWYTFIASVEPGVEVFPPTWKGMSNVFTGKEVEEAKAAIDGGIEAYMARQSARALQYHEEAVAKGAYAPQALAWCGRLDLAMKQVQNFVNQGYLDVHLVEVDA